MGSDRIHERRNRQYAQQHHEERPQPVASAPAQHGRAAEHQQQERHVELAPEPTSARCRSGLTHFLYRLRR